MNWYENHEPIQRTLLWAFDASNVKDIKIYSEKIYKIKLLKQKHIYPLPNFNNDDYIFPFKVLIDKFMSNAAKLNKVPIIVFPPTKPQYNNQIRNLLIRCFGYKGKYISIRSEKEFVLKGKKSEYRRSFLSSEYDKWIIRHNMTIIDWNYSIKNAHYFFVDDMSLDGSLAFFCYKALKNFLKKYNVNVIEKFEALIFCMKNNPGYPPKIPIEENEIGNFTQEHKNYKFNYFS